jgi:Holliday junction DNA helicase RuvA
VIASLRGRVQSVRLDSAVIEVGGVGMLVQATPATLAGLRVGAEATLATTLIVREDALTLFGFDDADERDVFESVQTVSGIGPRLALAMLAVHSPEGLRAAVASADLTALMRVPGIGRKGAQRLVLELADRLGPPSTPVAPGGRAPGTALAPAAAGQAWRDRVVDALVGLGWPARAAAEAVQAVSGEPGGPSDQPGEQPGDQPGEGAHELPGQVTAADGEQEVARVLRAALRHLGRVA